VETTGGSSTYEEARLLVDEIAHGLGGIPDLQTVEWQRDGVWVMFPECDFRLLPRVVGNRLVVSWQITVREPAPGLGTWWAERRTTYRAEAAVGRLIADLIEARQAICRQLRERGAGVPGATRHSAAERVERAPR
jgi:hypothetical protein